MKLRKKDFLRTESPAKKMMGVDCCCQHLPKCSDPAMQAASREEVAGVEGEHGV